MGRKKKYIPPDNWLEPRDKEDKTKGWDRHKWLEAHPEDQWIDDENQKARKTGYADDDVRQLMAAICLRACVDYKKASLDKKVGGVHPETIMDECDIFFKSDLFQFFVNRVPVEEIKRTIRATPEGAIHSIWKSNENNQQPVKSD